MDFGSLALQANRTGQACINKEVCSLKKLRYLQLCDGSLELAELFAFARPDAGDPLTIFPSPLVYESLLLMAQS